MSDTPKKTRSTKAQSSKKPKHHPNAERATASDPKPNQGHYTTSNPTEPAEHRDSDSTHNTVHNHDRNDGAGFDSAAPGMMDFWTGMVEQSTQFWQSYVSQFSKSGTRADPFHVARSFLSLANELQERPDLMENARKDFVNRYMQIYLNTLSRIQGEDENEPDPSHQDTAAQAKPAPGDRRFKDPAWTENAVFDFFRQTYLLASNLVEETVDSASEGLSATDREKIRFFTRQLTDAVSPTNFAMLNPAVLKETIETKGENFRQGLENFMADFDKDGSFRMSMTDPNAFVVGQDLAATKGRVVWKTPVFELLHYAPTTSDQYVRPLIIFPPWINRYYILDMRPENSLVLWLLNQGRDVFMVSWVNPDETLRDHSWDSYIDEAQEALRVVTEMTGQKKVDVAAYCIGGTLIATLLAWLGQSKADHPIASVTFFTTLLDFENSGEIKIFTDEAQIQDLEASMEKKGYLDGDKMAAAFNMLRANDLIWNFFVNNYLLGKKPPAFDLLYWNSDSTRLPGQTAQSVSAELLLLNNELGQGTFVVKGRKVRLADINVPSFFVATQDDHIAPWVGVYDGMKQITGSKRDFVLTGSGHIAGIINPAGGERTKYSYWYEGKSDASASDWLETTQQEPGSWWPYWHRWLLSQAEEKAPARPVETKDFRGLEDAPGSYVCKRY